MSCEPKGREMTAADWAKLDACERLQIVEFALLKLAAGEKRVSVWHGEYRVEYAPGSVTYLERERARLASICSKRRAVSVGWGNSGPCSPRRW